MKKIIFVLLSLFSLAVSADENINGGFVVAPILADGYVAYGDCLAPNEMENDEAGYVAGSYVAIISGQTATDIKRINAVSDKTYYSLQDNLLHVYSSASLYSLEGKRICSLKADAQMGTGSLPDVFILKFKDGSAWKLQK